MPDVLVEKKQQCSIEKAQEYQHSCTDHSHGCIYKKNYYEDEHNYLIYTGQNQSQPLLPIRGDLFFTKNLNFGWAFSLKLIAGSFIVLAKHSTCFLHVHVYYVSIVLAHH